MTNARANGTMILNGRKLNSSASYRPKQTFISQLLTSGIVKAWIIRQVRHTSRWIPADATGMAQFVSERLRASERLVPKWSQTRGEGLFYQLNQ